MIPFTEKQEQLILNHFGTLNERGKRLFASLQSKLLGRGGQLYISKILGISIKTINRGINELKKNNVAIKAPDSSRNKGGGRKGYEETYKNIDELFLELLKDNTAGDPMDTEVKWTNLKQEEIIKLFKNKFNINISRTVVRQLLDKNGFTKRKLQKDLPLKEVQFRNEQFIKIGQYKETYTSLGDPIISIDTKKKEMLGNFYRDGHLYCTETKYTFDHDFNNFAEGVLIPYGIYDYNKNIGYMYLGNSKDTSQFSIDNIKSWWKNYGVKIYPKSKSILILCDGGGSNNSRHYIFKEDLQKLANEIDMEIRIAHYPPYTSKYNPIEHRLFSYISKAWAGVVFDNLLRIKNLLEKTTTKKGLKIEVEIVDDVYEIGRKVANDFKENMKLIFDTELPKWNYKAMPQIN